LGLRWNPYLAEDLQSDFEAGSKTRNKAAIVAVARHLLVIAWTMLRKNEPWREPKVRRRGGMRPPPGWPWRANPGCLGGECRPARRNPPAI